MISPCKKICQLDDTKQCVGCGRSLEEIRLWARMTESERLAIMQRLKDERSHLDLALPIDGPDP